MRFTFMGRRYKLRDDSVIYTIASGSALVALIIMAGLMNSWELGLL